MAKKYKYKQCDEYGLLSTSEMNRLGEQGWELVSMTKESNTTHHYIFKLEEDVDKPKVKQIN